MNAFKYALNRLLKPLNVAATFFLEFATANYDPDTNQINGCRYGGFAWLHEDRHRQQFHNRFVSWFKHGASLFMHFSLFASTWGLIQLFVFRSELGLAFWLIAGVCSVPYTLFILTLEIDAWVYSVRNSKKRQI